VLTTAVALLLPLLEIIYYNIVIIATFEGSAVIVVLSSQPAAFANRDSVIAWRSNFDTCCSTGIHK
jgi:hypothetical protein